MLDLVRQAAQRVIAELCCLAADFRRCLAADFRDLIAHRIGPALQSVGYALQCGNDGLADPVGGLRGVCGGAAADALELPLQRTQTLVDVADFGGDRVGISRSRKHVSPKANSRSELLSSVHAFEPDVDLALGLVPRHAVAPLKPAAELRALTLDDVEIVVGEFAPLLLNLAFELFPIAFNSIPIHRVSPA